MIRFRTIATVTAALLAGCATEPASTSSSTPTRAFEHFVAYPQGHAWANSYLLALTCKYAPANTEDRAEFSKRMRAMGITRIGYFSQSVDGFAVQATVLSNSKIIIIVFRDPDSKPAIDLVNDWVLADSNLQMVQDERY